MSRQDDRDKPTAPWGPYRPQEIEPRWQQLWDERNLYLTDESEGKPKYYCLDFFPYPSGEGLHVGHCRNYVPTDVLSRLKRMQGYNVLHPMGWDAFGEPTEQYATAHGVDPHVTTRHNTVNFKRQMRLIGASYDWSREIDSSDPDYYRWTQWFFLLLYKQGLAYRDTNWQWWCPECKTTLSSHEVVGGVCWRGHSGVTKREIPAWYFRITDYADQLLAGLDEIDWPESIKNMQRNWIGRSEGCEVVFKTEDGDDVLVFTTRPDTLFGVTFLVLAPEHPLVKRLCSPDHRAEVEAYQAEAARKSEINRLSGEGEITGVFIGGYVLLPINQSRIPVWIADYVLPSYGTGAVMGVPAHDERDFAFARKYDLPVKTVIVPTDGLKTPLQDAYNGEGTMVESDRFTGLVSTEGIERICEYLEENSLGRRNVQYRMRDWLISRQRYWGAPIPIVYCDECGAVPVPEEQLPVWLPAVEDFKPDDSGRSPLSRVPEFANTQCPVCGGLAQRETDTMGGFACSSWYFLRFPNPHYTAGPFDPLAVDYWLPVDLYVGGAEHAVLHLLYARFWTHVMADEGLVPFREPFARLLNQGQLMGPDGKRMSKSRGNVITPDSIVESYGADALRIYALFIAPFEQDVNWSVEGIHGAWRFVNRVWNLYADSYLAGANTTDKDPELERLLNKTIRLVTERIETLRFNTMISTLMEFVNVLSERFHKNTWQTSTYHQSLDVLPLLLAPSAPYIAEEIWQRIGNTDSVHRQIWPTWDAELAQDEMVRIPVQVDGKMRSVITATADAEEGEVSALAFADKKVEQLLKGRQITKTYYVPGKIINIVTRPSSRKEREI